MTRYVGEVRIKTELDAKGVNDGMKKVSASLAGAGSAIAAASVRALVRIAALTAGIALIMKRVLKIDGFKDKFSELTHAFENLRNAALSAFMPLYDALLPTLMRIVDWLTRAANAAAAFFALLTGASTYSMYVSGEYADNMERAEDAAKGSVASFDKLNVLNKPAESGGGEGAGPGGEWVEKEIDFPWADELKDKLFLIKTIAKAIGVAILAWEISKLFGADLKTMFGLMIFVGGAVMFVSGAFDALENGVDWDNLALMVGGVALIFGGLWIVFGLTTAAIGLLVGGIVMLVVGIMDWVKKGELSTQTFWLLEAAIVAVGIALALLLGWPALAVAAIVGIALAVYKYWDEIKGFFIDLWEKIKGIWSKVATWFNEKVIQPIVDFFSPILNIIYVIFYDLWLLVKYVWGKASSWFKENVIDPIVKFFKGLWEDIKEVWEPVATWFQNNVIDPVVAAWDVAISKIGEFFSSMWEGVKNGAKTAINWVIEKLNGFLSGIVGGINKLIGKWNSVPIPGWLSIPLIEVPRIPYLATGAVIPPNAPFAAILGDQRSGTNIEAPLKTIEQAVENVLARRGINTAVDSGLIHNVIKLDGQVLYDAFKKMDKRIGKSLIAGSGIR